MQKTSRDDGKGSRDEPKASPMQRYAVVPPIAATQVSPRDPISLGTNYISSVPYPFPTPVSAPMFPFLYPPMMPFHNLPMYPPPYPMPQYMPYSVSMETSRPPQLVELQPQEQLVTPRVEGGVAELREDPAHMGVVSAVCEQLVASTVDTLTREVVNSCIDDIIRNYLPKASLLQEKLPPPLLCDDDTRPYSNPVTSGGGRLTSTDSPHTPSPSPHTAQLAGGRDHARLCLSQANTPAELAQYASSMLLDELMFEQLLAAAMTGQREMLLHSEAERILQGLLFEQLIEKLVNR